MKCMICEKEIDEEKDDWQTIAFSYKTFYFCSREHAEQYIMG